MVKILVLSCRVPYPLTAGYRIRIYNISRILAKHYQVDLLAIDEFRNGYEYSRALQEVFQNVILFPISKRYLQWHAAMHLFSSRPLQVAGYYFKEIQQWINKHYREYDLIYCNHIRMAEYVKNLDYAKLIDFHDAISMHYQKAIPYAKGFWKVFYRWENKRVFSYELEMLRRFDKAFIVSSVDKEYLLTNLKLDNPAATCCPIVVIPMGVKEEVLTRRPNTPPEENQIVFLGKMDYYPNEDAVIYFAKEIFPLIKGKIKDLEFIIVGVYPTKRVLQLKKIKGIKITGFVEDPYEYLERAKVVIAPMRLGAGIQNKILEAMALRKAVVTTPLGAQGIEGIDGKHFVVANDPAEMAEKILDLLRDDEKRRIIGENGRSLIEKKYTWDIVGQRVLEEIECLL